MVNATDSDQIKDLDSLLKGNLTNIRSLSTQFTLTFKNTNLYVFVDVSDSHQIQDLGYLLKDLEIDILIHTKNNKCSIVKIFSFK